MVDNRFEFPCQKDAPPSTVRGRESVPIGRFDHVGRTAAPVDDVLVLALAASSDDEENSTRQRRHYTFSTNLVGKSQRTQVSFPIDVPQVRLDHGAAELRIRRQLKQRTVRQSYLSNFIFTLI